MLHKTFYGWRNKYGGTEVSDALCPKTVGEEKRKLKRLVADLSRDSQGLKDLEEKTSNAKAKKAALEHVISSFGRDKRHGCLQFNFNGSGSQYVPKSKDDDKLRKRMGQLDQNNKPYGSPRLHFLLKQEGLVVNHKRAERIYKE